MPRGKKQNGSGNAQLRQSASTSLFPILRNLGVGAALSDRGALVLHQGVVEPPGYATPRKLCVIIDADSSRRGVSLDSLCEDIARRSPQQWKGSGRSMVFTAGKKRKCKVEFVLSGGKSPKILENFTEVVTISGVPVLPVHAILLHELLVRSSKRAVVIQMCLDAVGRVRLNELSPLWRSNQILTGVRRYVSKVPKSKPQWDALGIELDIPRVETVPANADEQRVADIESDDDVSDSDEDEVEPPPAGPSIPRVQEPGPVESASRNAGPTPFTFGSTGIVIRPSVDSRSAGSTAFPSGATGVSIRPGVHAHPPPTSGSHRNTIRCDNPVVDLVAREVVALLKELGFECAIFGSAACQLYGNTRIPGDLDVLVLPSASVTLDREWLKQHLVNQRPNQFKLIDGKTPGATYRVLYYKLGHEYQVPHPFRGPMHCKVDILVPGVMHLPHLSTTDIIWKGGLPVLPFLTLLLQKLQGWGDHLTSHEPHKFRKHVADARDIQELLSLLPQLKMNMIRPWRERALMSDEFQAASDDRVRQFCKAFPSTQEAWFKLGFEVD